MIASALQLELWRQDQVLKRLVSSDAPSSLELFALCTSYVWLNSLELVDEPRPLPPRFKYIGGIAVGEPDQQLDPAIKAIFERARRGVVLVSFGSVVNTTFMKPTTMNALLDAFARHADFEFVWKMTRVDENTVAHVRARATNVHPVGWTRQSTILGDHRRGRHTQTRSSLVAHPKTAAFVTHMGQNSYNEAVGRVAVAARRGPDL